MFRRVNILSSHAIITSREFPRVRVILISFLLTWSAFLLTFVVSLEVSGDTLARVKRSENMNSTASLLAYICIFVYIYILCFIDLISVSINVRCFIEGIGR